MSSDEYDVKMEILDGSQHHAIIQQEQSKSLDDQKYDTFLHIPFSDVDEIQDFLIDQSTRRRPFLSTHYTKIFSTQ